MKILSLNLWNYHEFDKRKPLIEDFIKKHNPDIIALQEVRDDLKSNFKKENQAMQLNKNLHYDYFKFIKTMDKDDGSIEGIALLSKYPIRDSKNIKLKQQPKDKYTRSFLYARLQAKKILNLFVVHFSPGDIFGELHLRETLFFAKKNRIKPIIVGDFNITDKNLVDQIMGEDYKSSASIKNYVSHPETGRTIDYAVIPKDYNFKSVICDGDGLSDHKALIVEI